MSATQPTQDDLDRLVGELRKRRSLVEILIDAADDICKKLENPTASVTILDQEKLRKAIDAVRGSRFVGSLNDK